MNKRKSLLCGVGLLMVALAIVVILFLSSNNPEDSTRNTSTASTAGGNESNAALASNPLDRNQGEKKEHGLGSARTLLLPGWVKISPNAIAKTLKDRENPQLTAAALIWTQDPAVWKMARETKDPKPLITAAMAISSTNPQERLDKALDLIKIDPANTLGYVAAMDAAFRLGDTEKVKTLFDSIPSDGNLNIYAADYQKGQKQLLELSGYNSVERGLLMSRDQWQQSVVQTISNLVSNSFKDVSNDEQASRANSLLELLDGYRKSAGEHLSYAISNQLSRSEELTLRRLPSDFKLDSSKSVLQQLEEMSSQRLAEMDKARRISEALETLDQTAIQEYFEIRESKGDAHASKWLIGE